MSIFFDRFVVTTADQRPPSTLRLSAALRTEAGQEPGILEYRLDEPNDIWFDNVDGNPGRTKVIHFSVSVDSGGTPLEVTARLTYGPGTRERAAFVRGAVLPPGGGAPMNRRDSQFLVS